MMLTDSPVESDEPSGMKDQVTDAWLLITWLDLKVHLSTPVVPFSTNTSPGVYTSTEATGYIPVTETEKQRKKKTRLDLNSS